MKHLSNQTEKLHLINRLINNLVTKSTRTASFFLYDLRAVEISSL